jgi:hypothetical protein
MVSWLHATLLAILFLPTSFAFDKVDIEIWVPESDMHDTVIELPQLGQEETDVLAIDYTPSDADTSWLTQDGGETRTIFYRIHTETFRKLMAFRPITFRRGTKEEDGGYRTEVCI